MRDPSQYDFNGELSYQRGDWHAVLSGQFAREHSDEFEYYTFSPPLHERFNFGNQISSGEIRADGPLLDLPGGELNVAVGASLRNEKSSGSFEGSLSGGRSVGSLYGEAFFPLVSPEMDVQFIKKFSIDLAGRYDHYTDFGGVFDPKVSARWDIDDNLHITGSYSESFRAPPLYALNLAVQNSLYIWPLVDPNSPTGQTTALIQNASNPDLKPERATSYTAAVTYNVPEGLTVTGDYFDIRYRNRIEELTDAGFYPGDVLTDAAALGPLINLSPSPAQINTALAAPGARIINYTGAPWSPSDITVIANLGWVNSAVWHPRGIDFQLRYDWESEIGEFYVDGTGTYIVG